MIIDIAVYLGEKEVERYQSVVYPAVGDEITIMGKRKDEPLPPQGRLRVERVRHGVLIIEGARTRQTSVEVWCTRVPREDRNPGSEDALTAAMNRVQELERAILSGDTTVCVGNGDMTDHGWKHYKGSSAMGERKP